MMLHNSISLKANRQEFNFRINPISEVLSTFWMQILMQSCRHLFILQLTVSYILG